MEQILPVQSNITAKISPVFYMLMILISSTCATKSQTWYSPYKTACPAGETSSLQQEVHLNLRNAFTTSWATAGITGGNGPSCIVTLTHSYRSPSHSWWHLLPNCTPFVRHSQGHIRGCNMPIGYTQCLMNAITSKAIEWASIAQNSRLWPRDFHISVHRKFRPKVKNGLCTNTSWYDDLVTAMHHPYYCMAPIGGLICKKRTLIPWHWFLWAWLSTLGYWIHHWVLQ